MENIMTKLKTKSGAKKRFKFTTTGKIKMSPAFKQHNLRKRSRKMKRHSKGMEIMNKADSKIIKIFMPYNR